SGGGAFFFIFLVFTLFIGLPILLAEFVIGRGSQKDAVRAYTSFAPKSQWHFVGVLGMITCFILLSFYSVVGFCVLIVISVTVILHFSIFPDVYYVLFTVQLIANAVLTVGTQLLFLIIILVIVYNCLHFCILLVS